MLIVVRGIQDSSYLRKYTILKLMVDREQCYDESHTIITHKMFVPI